ncbi:MAG: hypothetical protein M3Y28_00490 [Armatimonadota bacterium]|nr:hypothetical protein [Armatimonadota bacterium]
MHTEKQCDNPEIGTPRRLPLTAGERNLMFLTLMGQTPTEMAATLDLSVAEVHSALEGLQERFGVTNQRRLIVRALLRGWHAPPPY